MRRFLLRAHGTLLRKRLDQPQQPERRAALQPDVDAQPSAEELRHLLVEDGAELGLLVGDRIISAGLK